MQPHGGKSVTPKENSYNYNYLFSFGVIFLPPWGCIEVDTVYIYRQGPDQFLHDELY